MAGSNFVDYVRLFCASGNGGKGSMHLHREKFVPKGGPDGGDGGRGGHVILKGNSQFWTLIHLKYRKHIRAEHGEAGSGSLCHGANGADNFRCTVGNRCPPCDTEEVLFEHPKRRGEEPCQGGRADSECPSSECHQQTPRYPTGEPEKELVCAGTKAACRCGVVGF